MTQKIRIDVGFFLSFEKNQECKKDKNISNNLCILYVLLTSMKINIFNVKLMNKNFMKYLQKWLMMNMCQGNINIAKLTFYMSRNFQGGP